MSRDRHVNVTVRHVDVEVDLADIDEDDLEEELLVRRKVLPHMTTLAPNEQSNLVERYWLQIVREVSQGRKPSEFEVEFWKHIHGRYL